MEHSSDIGKNLSGASACLSLFWLLAHYAIKIVDPVFHAANSSFEIVPAVAVRLELAEIVIDKPLDCSDEACDNRYHAHH